VSRSPGVRLVTILVLLSVLVFPASALAEDGAAFSLSFRADESGVRLPQIVSGELFTVRVPIVNSDREEWSSWGTQPVRLAYHWLDREGRPALWDGLRTPLGSDVRPGEERTLTAVVRAPPAPGPYALAFELVREGVGWLGRPLTVPSVVAPAMHRAAITAESAAPALVGSEHIVPVSLTNTGNITWRANGPGATLLSYHWYDPTGERVLLWDGERTALREDLPPGASRTVGLRVTMPPRVGVYALKPDLVREGIGWFQGAVPLASTFVRATTELNAEWERTTTPYAITPNARMPVDLVVTNAGLKRWDAGAAYVSYHWYDADGREVQWEGARYELPSDVAPGEKASLLVDVRAPSTPGVYRIDWDVVQEGVGWASRQSGIAKRETVVVQHGVTFYGKGWGHGVGLSQWGAQGWAEGAVGQPLVGEEIVAKYYPGTQIARLPENASPIRVLLSTPSTACVERTITSVAHVRAESGVRLVWELDESVVIYVAPPGHTLRASSDGGGVTVVDVTSGAIAYAGTGPVAMFSVNPARPLLVDEKGLAYRNKLVFESGYGGLRVVNHVTPEEYMRGSLPGEMPARWHIEALRAQAFAGLSFALWRQSGMRHMPYDIRDDTTDQCYGGAGFESPRTDHAVASTAHQYLAHSGRPIRAYYSASNGGAIETNACVWDVDLARGGLACGQSEPYLQPAADPADLRAFDAKGANPHRLWSATFTGAALRWFAYQSSGVDIGPFVGIDLSNRSAAGYVVSVRVNGTHGSVELRGERFLRGVLGLNTSLVRLEPF
jgi:SpoIID/LytB domain protein